MKKSNFLKIAFTLVLAFAISGAFAQALDNNLAVDVNHTVTVGKTVPFYVEPDAYFNTNYTVGGGWAVTSTFEWSFDNATLTGAVDPSTVNPTITGPTTINPSITFAETGAYTLAVRESSATCDGDIKLQDIVVIAVPTTDFGARPDVAADCGPLNAYTVVFDIAANTATDFKVDWTLDVDNLAFDLGSVTDELDGTGPSTLDLDESITDADFVAAGTGLTLRTQDFVVVNGEVTRYTFTLTGINDAVSRACDYDGTTWPSVAADWISYAVGGDNTFVITRLPAPTTGDIYHIDI